ncbi:MAG: OmpA family protein [Rhizobiales bacterium]|nr:OmpA family protein [Rhizobacter sp.]
MTPAPIARLALALSIALPAAGTAIAADGAVEKVSVRAVARFDFDRASIRPEDRDALLAEVGKMKDVTWQTVTATGHTDAIGPSGYNARLSAKRAQTVKSYLVGKGLSPSMIRTDAKAATAPVADNESEDGRAKNRRTEIEFQGVRAVAAK